MSNTQNLLNAAPVSSLDPNQNQFQAQVYDSVRQDFINMCAIFQTKPGWRNVLGVRTETLVSKENMYGVYDDYIWVVHRDNCGIKYASYYSANTDPSYQYVIKKQGRDANNDGKNDIGRLPSGVYQYSTSMVHSPTLGRMVFKLLRSQRVHRDINKDGRFTAEDEQLITKEAAMMEGRTMHIHAGNANNTWSAGCQTIRLADFQKFQEEMRIARENFKQAAFTYVLLNALTR